MAVVTKRPNRKRGGGSGYRPIRVKVDKPALIKAIGTDPRTIAFMHSVGLGLASAMDDGNVPRGKKDWRGTGGRVRIHTFSRRVQDETFYRVWVGSDGRPITVVTAGKGTYDPGFFVLFLEFGTKYRRRRIYMRPRIRDYIRSSKYLDPRKRKVEGAQKWPKEPIV